jgi:hypothetical protein
MDVASSSHDGPPCLSSFVSLYRLDRMSNQNISPWVTSAGGTTTVGMKQAAPSMLSPNNA